MTDNVLSAASITVLSEVHCLSSAHVTAYTEKKRCFSGILSMLPPALPPSALDPLRPSIIDSLAKQANLVLVSPPGSGKSTRIPLWLHASELFHGKILLLEPRRMAVLACRPSCRTSA